MTTSPSAAVIEPLLLTINEGVRISGISRSVLYLHMADGSLIARKAGRRTLIELTSLKALVASLPVATIGPQRRRAA